MIEVIQAGPVVTVQDLGREGFRHHGVSRAGALDGLALTIANRLVGNSDNAAGLEMMFGATTLLFERDVCFALAGSDCFATLDGTPVYPGWRSYAQAGQMLRLSTPKRGLCAYLAVQGGIDVPRVMESAATDLQAGFGGVDGRSLRKGDRLLLKESRQPLQNDPDETVGVLLPITEAVIRVCAGPEAGLYPEHARERFFSSAWKVSVSSNRMGFRLEGPPIADTLDGNLLSHGVFPGVIQIPPDGQPIILAAEGQTSGGYPRMAVVIDSDLWRLGQLRPGELIYFQEVSLQEAAVAADKQARYLQRIAFALASH